MENKYPEDPWVTDNNILFLPLYGRLINGFWEKSELKVNEVLEEWGYDQRLTTQDLQTRKTSIWVDLNVIHEEIWPSYGVSKVPVKRFWELYRYDLEDFDYEEE